MSESAGCTSTRRRLSSASLAAARNLGAVITCSYSHVKRPSIPLSRCSIGSNQHDSLSLPQPSPRDATQRDTRRKRGTPMNTHNEALEKVLRGLATAIRFIEDL